MAKTNLAKDKTISIKTPSEILVSDPFFYDDARWLEEENCFHYKPKCKMNINKMIVHQITNSHKVYSWMTGTYDRVTTKINQVKIIITNDIHYLNLGINDDCNLDRLKTRHHLPTNNKVFEIIVDNKSESFKLDTSDFYGQYLEYASDGDGIFLILMVPDEVTPYNIFCEKLERLFERKE